MKRKTIYKCLGTQGDKMSSFRVFANSKSEAVATIKKEHPKFSLSTISGPFFEIVEFTMLPQLDVLQQRWFVNLPKGMSLSFEGVEISIEREDDLLIVKMNEIDLDPGQSGDISYVIDRGVFKLDVKEVTPMSWKGIICIPARISAGTNHIALTANCFVGKMELEFRRIK
jgi:hypothetical protein